MAQPSNPIARRAAALAAAGTVAALGYLVPVMEGSSTTAYRDPIGIPTICEGWTEGVKMGDTKTPAQCAALLKPRLEAEVAYVNTLVPNMPATRQVALGDLSYSIGRTALARSSIVRKLREGDVPGGCGAILLYNKAGGQVLPGLVKRREIDRELCLATN